MPRPEFTDLQEGLPHNSVRQGGIEDQFFTWDSSAGTSSPIASGGVGQETHSDSQDKYISAVSSAFREGNTPADPELVTCIATVVGPNGDQQQVVFHPGEAIALPVPMLMDADQNPGMVVSVFNNASTDVSLSVYVNSWARP